MVLLFLTGNSYSTACLTLLILCNTEQEWWTIWGIIFVACPCHKGGQKLFQSEQQPGRLAPVIDMSVDKARFDEATGIIGKKKISWNRFKTIKEYLWAAFDNGDDEDPWHPIAGLVDDFNANRKKWIVAELERVLDESMSAFQPRTTRCRSYRSLFSSSGSPNLWELNIKWQHVPERGSSPISRSSEDQLQCVFYLSMLLSAQRLHVVFVLSLVESTLALPTKSERIWRRGGNDILSLLTLGLAASN